MRNSKIRGRYWASAGLITLALGGCASDYTPPLIFGQSTSLGLTISGAAAEQGGKINLGFDQHNLAIIPVLDNGVQGRGSDNGSTRSVLAYQQKDDTSAQYDALSVFGAFSTDGGAGTSPVFGLQSFFATGIAAVELARDDDWSFNKTKKPEGQGTTQEEEAATTDSEE